MVCYIGLGGGGCSIVRTLAAEGRVQHGLLLDSDFASLKREGRAQVLQVGPLCCGGRGSGGKRQIAEAALQESERSIEAAVRPFDEIVIVATNGGGMGGASWLLAQWCKCMGKRVVAATTRPFHFEGRTRREQALLAEQLLIDAGVEPISLENQELLSAEYRGVPLLELLHCSAHRLFLTLHNISTIDSTSFSAHPVHKRWH